MAETIIARVGTVLGVRPHGDSNISFSLVTACWLFDFAWAAYFDVPGYVTPSSFGAFPEGQTPHEFKVRLLRW